MAVKIAAGAAHSSVVTRDGIVLSWRSMDPTLTSQEVGDSLAGRHVVSISAGTHLWFKFSALGPFFWSPSVPVLAVSLFSLYPYSLKAVFLEACQAYLRVCSPLCPVPSPFGSYFEGFYCVSCATSYLHLLFKSL